MQACCLPTLALLWSPPTNTSRLMSDLVWNLASVKVQMISSQLKLFDQQLVLLSGFNHLYSYTFLLCSLFLVYVFTSRLKWDRKKILTEILVRQSWAVGESRGEVMCERRKSPLPHLLSIITSTQDWTDWTEALLLLLHLHSWDLGFWLQGFI